jgi:hypothetical protein
MMILVFCFFGCEIMMDDGFQIGSKRSTNDLCVSGVLWSENQREDKAVVEKDFVFSFALNFRDWFSRRMTQHIHASMTDAMRNIRRCSSRHHIDHSL